LRVESKADPQLKPINRPKISRKYGGSLGK
jgi:hypothetical protein